MPAAARPVPSRTGPAWPRSCSCVAPPPCGRCSRLASSAAAASRPAGGGLPSGPRRGVRAAPGGPAGRARRGGPAGLVPGQRGLLSLRAVRGGLTGANPVDRAKPGSKLHVANEGGGMPLSLLVTAANTPDAAVFEALLEDIPRVVTPRVAGAAGQARPTRTRPTTTAAAAPTCPAGGSGSASPAVGWSRLPGWAATAGRRSARSPGCLAAGGCGCAMTAARSGSLRSRCWLAPGFATTAASMRATRLVAPAFSVPECPLRFTIRGEAILNASVPFV
jgi:hypothetical protein